MNTTEVWADDAPGQGPGAKLPGIRGLVLLTALALFGAVGGSIWTYISGLEAMHALAAQLADKAGSAASSARTAAGIMEQANRWTVQMALAGVASSGALFAVSLLCGQVLRRRWLKRHEASALEADARAQRLLGQLADSKVTEEEARKAHTEMKERLSALSERHADMQKEVEQRRQAEKSLAQQTTLLERSKDVLELHVQERTRELQKLQRRNELILNSAAEGICGFDLHRAARLL